MNEAPPLLERRSEARRSATGFVLILVAAAALRLAQLNAQSLSMDEVKDLAMARGGVAKLQSSEDRFPPLYHALLGCWLKAVPADLTGRGFSTLCGVLTVAAVAGLGRVVGGRAVGLWSAGIMAAAPLAVWYSVEARAYSLYLLFAAVALWQFAVAMRDNRRGHWAGFAFAATAGAYTHYYFGLLIAIAGLVFLATRPRREQFLRGMTAFACIAVATAPSLWLLKNDLDQPWGYARTSGFSFSGLTYTYFSYLSGYTLGPSLRELHTLSSRDAMLAAAPWLLTVAAAAGTLAVLAAASFPAPERLGRIVRFAAFCLAPAAIIGAVSHFADFGYNVRHAVWAIVPLSVALAVGIDHGRPRWLAATAVALLGLCFVVAQSNRLTTLTHANEDVRGAAALIAAEPQAPVFVLSGYMSKALAAYLPSDWPMIALPDAEADADAVEELHGRVAPGDSLWLVYTRQFHGDPEGTRFVEIDQAFDLKLVSELAGIRLYSGTAR